MTELISWLQDNWLELGSLVAQGAIAVALLFYGRKALKMLEASRQPQPEAAAQRWAVQSAPLGRFETPAVEEPQEPRIGVGHRVAHWLQEPMTRRGPSPWRKVARWLQAPVGS